ncbi:MAG: hypothetical protein HGA38_02960 [Candidatus Moranbacteria bacterium]|nr:hypothetical protein [Candidatus Moranbacteria bacterium]NTW46339.1 hypothetical protein [Candidatus Moranbacteria bacterium]
MRLDTTGLSTEELRRLITEFRNQLPEDLCPVEPPDNAWNGYWKHCSVCGFERLFPGSPQGDSAAPHCRYCGGEIIWSGPRNILIMSEPELREYFIQLDRRLNRTVSPKNSRTSDYFKECDLCEYRFLRPRRGDLPPDDYCEQCGSKIVWPT